MTTAQTIGKRFSTTEDRLSQEELSIQRQLRQRRILNSCIKLLVVFLIGFALGYAWRMELETPPRLERIETGGVVSPEIKSGDGALMDLLHRGCKKDLPRFWGTYRLASFRKVAVRVFKRENPPPLDSRFSLV